MRPIRVLVVDDSPLVRDLLSRGLEVDPEIQVVGQAADPHQARDRILELRPDVLTLDVEMPKMDGVEFLRRLMPRYPLPVVMVSSLTQRGKQTTFEALSAGAVDFVAKPSMGSVNGMLSELRSKVKVASGANVQRPDHSRSAPRREERALPATADRVLAIGASTGGTEALRQLVSQFPPNMVGTVIVQHMPPGFTSMFAQSLDAQCVVTVKEARSGDVIRPGMVLIAPGDLHTTVHRAKDMHVVVCKSGEKVCGHRPSVDMLFKSVAKACGKKAIGVVLTGMGQDGADGMLAMRRSGAKTLAQNRETSVVFGMPKAAYERGGVEELLPLQAIPGKLMRLLAEEDI
ncbi:MAG: chemotaxis response regulator protein-glutamate methylesterase [Calditrichaeota bacterium]|nr:MAG: chemotaxis response regulator protein-glutamate methylesterase [Calditrichota bacterium]